jgi:hypothetical protein
MNITYGNFGRIAKIAIATGALLLATATAGCRIAGVGYQSKSETTESTVTRQKIAKNIDFLINHAKENKSGQWKKDNVIGSGLQDYSLSYNNLYLCLTLKNGKFYFLNYSGLKPYTANPLVFFDRSEDGPGFSEPGVNAYEEKAREGKMYLRINSESSKNSMDYANKAELSALEWLVKTQLK